MSIIILLLPIIVAIFLLFFFPKQVTWWEYCLLVVPSILFFLVSKTIIIATEESDVEYLGCYMAKIRHYDPWNEYIHRTCTRTISSGKSTISIPYDCSYVDYHPDMYSYFDNNGNEHYIWKEYYESIKEKWNKESSIFVDMKRHYYTKDGDAQDIYWNKSHELLCQGLTYLHSYTNKVNASKSIFKFDEIDKYKAKKIGLYDYPKIDNDFSYQQQILGWKNKDKLSIKLINFINAYYGKSYQFRMYILCFYNKSINIAKHQRSYWNGGNKNEFIVCLGIDSISNNVNWSYPFSWQDNPLLEAKVKQYFIENNNLNIYKFGRFIQKNIKYCWKRKSFDDFNYLSVDLTQKQYMWIMIFIAIYNIGISIYAIFNRYTN